jgi:hypothetical protein
VYERERVDIALDGIKMQRRNLGLSWGKKYA